MELGRYLSTVKESKKDFIHHFTICRGMAESMGEHVIIERCDREIESLKLLIRDEPREGTREVQMEEAKQDDRIVDIADAKARYAKGKDWIQDRKCKKIYE